MNRVFMYLSALVGLGGMFYLAGTSQAQPPAAAAAQPTAQARPTIAVFNMAAVMRDYGKAKFQVFQLNKKREDMSKDLVQWRGEYLKAQKDHAAAGDPKIKSDLEKKLVELARNIEDKDREINKALNDEASKIISQLYDDIKMVVDKTAEMNGYHIVFAYPDAVTDEEKKSPYLKELKLKPPAAQPFYVAPQVDVTGVVVATLNKWYPAPAVPDTPPPATPGNSGVPGTGAPGTGIPGTTPVPMGAVPAPTRP